MSYFAHIGNAQAANPRGKAVGVYAVPEMPAVKPVDAIRREQIQAMQHNAVDPFTARQPERDFGVHHGKARVVPLGSDPSSARGNVGSSNIFGPPVANPVPHRRIRIGVSDDELKQLWREDDAKVRAADRMASKTNMVHRMDAGRKQAVPFALGNERLVSSKVKADLPKPAANTAEVAGFGGMGAYCAPDHRYGKAVKPTGAAAASQFEPPAAPAPYRPARRSLRPQDDFTLA